MNHFRELDASSFQKRPSRSSSGLATRSNNWRVTRPKHLYIVPTLYWQFLRAIARNKSSFVESNNRCRRDVCDSTRAWAPSRATEQRAARSCRRTIGECGVCALAGKKGCVSYQRPYLHIPFCLVQTFSQRNRDSRALDLLRSCAPIVISLGIWLIMALLLISLVVILQIDHANSLGRLYLQRCIFHQLWPLKVSIKN